MKIQFVEPGQVNGLTHSKSVGWYSYLRQENDTGYFEAIRLLKIVHSHISVSKFGMLNQRETTSCLKHDPQASINSILNLTSSYKIWNEANRMNWYSCSPELHTFRPSDSVNPRTKEERHTRNFQLPSMEKNR